MRASLLEEVWKTPLRLRNLTLLKSPYFKGDIAGTPFTSLGSRGRSRLLKFLPTSGITPSGKAIFITPSLINRYYILDLLKGCSFIENLCDHGHTVYLIDWGEPRPQDRFATIEDHILNWMDWGIEKAREDAGLEKIHLLGQCIGGTFGAIYTALHPEKIKTLTLITAPIDFHIDGTFYRWANDANVNVDEMSEVWGNISSDFLNQTFKMLTPLGELKQFQNLIKNSWNTEFVRKHAAMTSWISDNINFPGKTYKRFITSFYQNNELIKGTFSLGENKVDLKKIEVPTLCFYANGDIIVPAESATAISQFIDPLAYHEVALGGGHIGCVVSNKHQKKMWAETETWLKSH